MKYNKNIGIFLYTIGLMAVSIFWMQPTFAAPSDRACSEVGSSAFCQSRQDELISSNGDKGLNGIINILLYIVGVIAVIAIIIGGIRYVTANGDANQVKSAKNTVLYAVIGLIMALMSLGIVRFVFDMVS